MTTPPLTLPAGTAPSSPGKKKRILLIDASRSKCELRAEVMRKLGIEVDCAADISEAHSWWRTDLYDLVLFSDGHETSELESFCEKLRGAKPAQAFCFLVGKPRYLADLPERAILEQREEIPIPEKAAALVAEPGEAGHRWGILECSRRISAARSKCNALVKAKQTQPAPIRDTEKRAAKPSSPPAVWSTRDGQDF
jgi:hypothetical protein